MINIPKGILPPEMVLELYKKELCVLPKERLADMVISLKSKVETLQQTIELLKDSGDERGYN